MRVFFVPRPEFRSDRDRVQSAGPITHGNLRCPPKRSRFDGNEGDYLLPTRQSDCGIRSETCGIEAHVFPVALRARIAGN